MHRLQGGGCEGSRLSPCAPCSSSSTPSCHSPCLSLPVLCLPRPTLLSFVAPSPWRPCWTVSARTKGRVSPSPRVSQHPALREQSWRDGRQGGRFPFGQGKCRVPPPTKSVNHGVPPGGMAERCRWSGVEPQGPSLLLTPNKPKHTQWPWHCGLRLPGPASVPPPLPPPHQGVCGRTESLSWGRALWRPRVWLAQHRSGPRGMALM